MAVSKNSNIYKIFTNLQFDSNNGCSIKIKIEKIVVYPIHYNQYNPDIIGHVLRLLITVKWLTDNPWMWFCVE